MPAFRVLVNTPSPQGSVGITTTLQPAMTLGCGAIAGNATGDNVGPMHLVHVKRVAALVREPGTVSSSTTMAATVDRNQLLSAVERYVAARGVSVRNEATGESVAAAVVDRFLARKAAAPATAPVAPSELAAATVAPSCARPAPAAEAIDIAPFVCEADIRQAMRKQEKIYIGPRTIVTPSARDLGAQYDILVMTERPAAGPRKSNDE